MKRYNQGDYKKAIADYSQSIALKPDFAEAYKSRGDARLKLAFGVPDPVVDYRRVASSVTDAKADYNQAIKLKPNFAEAYNNGGELFHYWEGNVQKATADYTQAIRLKLDFAEPYFNRGAIYKYYCDRQSAIENFQKAAALYKQQGNVERYQNALSLVRNFRQPKSLNTGC